MIFDIRILSVGKNKDLWLTDALAEYEKRLKAEVKVEWVLLKNDAELEKAVALAKNTIALDPAGKTYTSEAFSTFLIKEIEFNGGELTFVIGSSDGLTPFMRKNARALISLSSLTFTHQLTRLVLLEQIYRALQIYKNTPYHK